MNLLFECLRHTGSVLRWIFVLRVPVIIAELFPTESAAFINKNYPDPQPTATDAGILKGGLFCQANLPFS